MKNIKYVTESISTNPNVSVSADTTSKRRAQLPAARREVKTTFMLPKDLHKDIRFRAIEQEMSMRAFVVKALLEAVAKK